MYCIHVAPQGLRFYKIPISIQMLKNTQRNKPYGTKKTSHLPIRFTRPVRCLDYQPSFKDRKYSFF